MDFVNSRRKMSKEKSFWAEVDFLYYLQLFAFYDRKKRQIFLPLLRDEKKYFSSRRLTLIGARRRGKSPDRHTQVCRGAFDEVSKNVFTEPFEGSVNFFAMCLFFNLPKSP